MDYTLLLYLQRFIVATLFAAAVFLWYKISNENPALYKSRHAIKFVLMVAFILIIKALLVLPDPGNVRFILQHLLMSVLALGFFFEIKKVYKKNIAIRKKEIKIDNMETELVQKTPVLKPKRSEGLKNLIQQHKDRKLEKKTEKLEQWEDKLGDLKDDLGIEKEKLLRLNKELEVKEKQLSLFEGSLSTREKKLQKKELVHGKKEEELKQKTEEIHSIKNKIKEEQKDIDRKIKTMSLLEEDIKDKKEDIQIEQKKLEKLKNA
ncbi:MAG: tektin family protein [Nanoarchaeota archaeon]|nr:tektin family protein [Nanoarchaeota archaeon]MCG2719090.1 tektin family protein [Nanoarchaeota archaeon]